MSTTVGRSGTLAGMVDRRVHVITNDGRHIVGTLRGFDQVVNVILEDCHERVYSSESGVEEAPLGLYVIRGDNVCVFATLAMTRFFLFHSTPALSSRFFFRRSASVALETDLTVLYSFRFLTAPSSGRWTKS